MNKLVIERYSSLKSLIKDRKDQFDRLISFMEKETTWLTAPASTKYHLCKEGGLLEHSVNVAETMLKIKSAIAPEIKDESCLSSPLELLEKRHAYYSFDGCICRSL